MGILKVFVFSLFLSILISCTTGDSCENEYCRSSYTPEYCKQENHTSGKVRFYLATDSLNPKVLVKVYYGDIEVDI